LRINISRTINNDSLPKYIQNIPNDLDELYDYESQDPNDQASEILDSQCPNVLNFTEEDRGLKSEFNLEYTNYPKALQNLASLANLDLDQLHNSIKNNDVGQIETIIQRANSRLEEIFKDTWSQSGVHVHLKLDGYLLHILVGSVDISFLSIAERSDGLRWFVALLSFLN